VDGKGVVVVVTRLELAEGVHGEGCTSLRRSSRLCLIVAGTYLITFSLGAKGWEVDGEEGKEGETGGEQLREMDGDGEQEGDGGQEVHGEEV
jgi:hypothetical protein